MTDNDEGALETLGKGIDKVSKHPVWSKVLAVLMVAVLGGGGGMQMEWFGLFGEEENPTPGPVTVPGCMQVTAINYDPHATYDNGSCHFPPPVIYGCTNSTASNFDSRATNDDGSCEFEEEDVYGCTDEEATNYNEDATRDDGSCEYEEEPEECEPEPYFWDTAFYAYDSNDNNMTDTLTIDFDADVNCGATINATIRAEVYNSTGDVYDEWEFTNYTINGTSAEYYWMEDTVDAGNYTISIWIEWCNDEDECIWNKIEYTEPVTVEETKRYGDA